MSDVLRELWKVAEYSDEEIEILANNEVHVAFCNNSPTGRKIAHRIVKQHNVAEITHRERCDDPWCERCYGSNPRLAEGFHPIY